MKPISVIDVVGGTTLKPTWTNSGVTPSSLTSALLDRDETVLHSMAAVSSGNGHYYAVHHVPSSHDFYVNRWIAFIEANTYQYRQLVRSHKLEV